MAKKKMPSASSPAFCRGLRVKHYWHGAAKMGGAGKAKVTFQELPSNIEHSCTYTNPESDTG
jgi:hypothetical protein